MDCIRSQFPLLRGRLCLAELSFVSGEVFEQPKRPFQELTISSNLSECANQSWRNFKGVDSSYSPAPLSILVRRSNTNLEHPNKPTSCPTMLLGKLGQRNPDGFAP